MQQSTKAGKRRIPRSFSVCIHINDSLLCNALHEVVGQVKSIKDKTCTYNTEGSDIAIEL